jgi:hypothetical protein
MFSSFELDPVSVIWKTKLSIKMENNNFTHQIKLTGSSPIQMERILVPKTLIMTQREDGDPLVFKWNLKICFMVRIKFILYNLLHDIYVATTF